MSNNGIIIKAISGFYYVACGQEVFECKARGVFRKENISPCVGDLVTITVCSPGYGILEKVLPRKNHLTRPVISNLDKLFIVSSYSNPAPNPLMIDRLIIMCEHNGIEPVLVFNKSDMGDFTEWSQLYSKAGFSTYTVSCTENSGVDELHSELENCTCAFAGNSGVGKSSILGLLLPDMTFATGEVSLKLGRGRHTTRQVELFVHPYGGYVADTPGFAAVDNDIYDADFKNHLALCFREFEPYIDSCRFTGCSHTGEKGCAVCAAVHDGKIAVSRHESYVTVYRELQELKPWESKNKG